MSRAIATTASWPRGIARCSSASTASRGAKRARAPATRSRGSPRTTSASVTSISSTPRAAPRSGVSRRPSPCGPAARKRPPRGATDLDLTKLRGRRWVTRPRPHIDRIASAWLIKRFIDPDAQFVFAPPAEFPKDAIPFDAPGVELSHQGEDCTFETLVKRARLRDRRLVRLAELVHEADLRDGKYPHEEARGIDVAIRALLAASPDDHQVLANGMTLFEGLYATTARKS